MLFSMILIREPEVRVSARGTLGTIPGVDPPLFLPPARPWGERHRLTLAAWLTTVLLAVVCGAQRAMSFESFQHLHMWHLLLF